MMLVYQNMKPYRISLAYARYVVDFVGKLTAVAHPTRPTQPSIPPGSVNE